MRREHIEELKSADKGWGHERHARLERSKSGDLEGIRFLATCQIEASRWFIVPGTFKTGSPKSDLEVNKVRGEFTWAGILVIQSVDGFHFRNIYSHRRTTVSLNLFRFCITKYLTLLILCVAAFASTSG